MMISTSGMAGDVVVLLDYIGWTGHRELHIVGISMGGMISQGEHVCEGIRSYSFTIIPELALRIPHRIASLSLVATKAGVRFSAMNLTPVGYPETICILDADFVYPVDRDVHSASVSLGYSSH
jgi:pimeloyl-ACP methyl ester carboxylesterase